MAVAHGHGSIWRPMAIDDSSTLCTKYEQLVTLTVQGPGSGL